MCLILDLDFNHPKDHFQVLYLHTQAGKDLPGSLAAELRSLSSKSSCVKSWCFWDFS